MTEHEKGGLGILLLVGILLLLSIAKSVAKLETDQIIEILILSVVGVVIFIWSGNKGKQND
jgi:uncharacterized membrane protein